MEPGFSIPWGYILLSKKELKELTDKAEDCVCTRKRIAGELLIADGKLDAIKNRRDEFPCINVQDYQRMLRKIDEILEAS